MKAEYFVEVLPLGQNSPPVLPQLWDLHGIYAGSTESRPKRWFWPPSPQLKPDTPRGTWFLGNEGSAITSFNRNQWYQEEKQSHYSYNLTKKKSSLCWGPYQPTALLLIAVNDWPLGHQGHGPPDQSLPFHSSQTLACRELLCPPIFLPLLVCTSIASVLQQRWDVQSPIRTPQHTAAYPSSPGLTHLSSQLDDNHCVTNILDAPPSKSSICPTKHSSYRIECPLL